MNVEFTDRRLPHELQCSTIEGGGAPLSTTIRFIQCTAEPVHLALLGSSGTYTGKISLTGGGTIQVIRQLLPRPQFSQSVARDPARGGGIDGADVLGGGDGRAPQMRIALADGAQGPVYPPLYQVCFV